ncbi:MAG: agmatinase family protein [Prevotellaceae bacterium]|jgi:agmatinase|nr:agmatinase family protein [Prevotellaceae bacterium]
MNSFDPNGIGQPNGRYFALPYTVEEAEIVLIPVPWDVTTSYHTGASRGPQAILEASTQVDLFDFSIENAWQIKIGTHPINEGIYSRSIELRNDAEHVIRHLEEGGDPDEKVIVKRIQRINEASAELNDWVRFHSLDYLDKGKLVGIVGGEHSVPLGLIKVLSGRYANFGVLHIDAHADLREAYEGFTHSHASIMYNVLHEVENIERLVQVGIRDLSQDEMCFADQDDRIVMFNDEALSEAMFSGKNWQQLCNDIINKLPENVYVSFDIDGLSPDLCPNTGTPVPGGLSFQQATYLLRTLAKSGRRIIGFDLNEVASNENIDLDANVGARLLYKLCCYSHIANNNLIKT